MGDRWYVVQTKSNQEQFTALQLQNQNFDVFYPAYQKIIIKRKQKIPTIFPLYPSYIFVKFNIDEDRWRCINSTKGALGLVFSTEDHVTPLPNGFVETMMLQLDQEGLVSLETSVDEMLKYEPGKQYVLKDNKFNELVGICCDQSEERVLLLFDLLGRKIKIDLPKLSIKLPDGELGR